MSDEPEGIREGVEGSKGDPRLLLLLNAVLSAWFAWTVSWGLDMLDIASLTTTNVGALALIIFVLTYVLVLR
ncbi:hypothetical protein C461_12973 [Halorubrum aidingense JCM 13560]|uniref:DUF8107 domain-containing protein n=1 Tax=Halorubrum aidingense JCM 13560 TaxID=1230454 RepID=M0PB98_9EURY|nr:hypothetical protein [Halorubrum aidingense]EMA66085.1 hypothetical protein C461_12973 [Halorubrum aidingense JCM 13560]